jgi:predicted DNA-binding WGR domain protein
MIFFTRTDPTRNVNRFYIVENFKGTLRLVYDPLNARLESHRACA